MTHQKNGNGHGGGTAVEPVDCQPCSVPAFCRSNYYTGKLLTERDFSGEQRYHADKLRLHYMALHGYGLVCGLTVEPHPYCPHLRIVIDPGLGIDDCGREVRVLKCVELELPRPPAKPPKQPCPPEPTQTPNEPPEAKQAGEATDVPRAYEQAPEPPPAGPDTETEDEPPVLYVCVRYCEQQTEMTPAPFDDCGCNSSGQKPNRICETYEFRIFEGEPDFMECIREHTGCCEEEICIDIYKRILKPCRKPGCVHWLPLATIKNFCAGEHYTVEQMKHRIDNWTVRPLLPSTRMLDHLIQCILERLPPQPLTTIDHINWDHGQLYTCRHFLTEYTGDGGFEITFSGPVHPDGISINSFQATVVFHPQNPSEPRAMEVAPARVEIDPDGRKCRLHLDHHYGQNRLNGHNFDLFIRLRCDVIVDERGNAVDGNLLARYNAENNTYSVETPTGDAIPGGLFESWIQVRMTAPKRL